MNTYVDSSVLIRLLFGQPNQLTTWPNITQAVSSELVRVECLRTIDRAAIRGNLSGEQVAMPGPRNAYRPWPRSRALPDVAWNP